MLNKSSRSCFSSEPWSIAAPSKASNAARLAIRYPSTTVCGCIFWIVTSFSASRSNSDASTQTEVVPSPTSSSWTFEMLTKIFAAGLSSEIDFNIVAPSFVTVMVWLEADSKQVSVPLLEKDGVHTKDFVHALVIRNQMRLIPNSETRTLGPSVDFTKSPRAMAPTNDDRRAFSPLSSVAYTKN